ncbi:MAG: AbrB/MazE/SpoVT family DNA-binding domain-containing protein [Candidatus Chisholmbacteria bacterium]|nr:AbrB/MazE/SpoVT family DNA-binding domain-containing protein [Candidatus Chisholmbacteria bacterium]
MTLVIILEDGNIGNWNMQLTTQPQLVKILPKGLMTIPKKFRQQLGFEENGLARVKPDAGRLIVEPVRTLPYPVRSYTDKEIDEFLKLDEEETKNLKKKGWL